MKPITNVALESAPANKLTAQNSGKRNKAAIADRPIEGHGERELLVVPQQHLGLLGKRLRLGIALDGASDIFPKPRYPRRGSRVAWFTSSTWASVRCR